MPTSTAVRHFTMPKSLAESLSDSNGYSEGRSLENVKKVSAEYSKYEKDPLGGNQTPRKPGITFAAQDKLPKLPIPELESSLKKYLTALKPLQGPREYAETQQAVEEFLKGDGPELQEKLKKYATGKTSYIEQFCEFCRVYSVELDVGRSIACSGLSRIDPLLSLRGPLSW
jgi:carnitine O-acetyltransferase